MTDSQQPTVALMHGAFADAFGLDVGESCASAREPFPPSLAAPAEKALG